MSKDNVIISLKDQLLASNDILTKSIALLWCFNASDMLFIPYESYISLKLKGEQERDLTFIEDKKYERLKLSIKLSCNLSILIDNMPQTGTFKVVIDKKEYAIRASFHPSNFGECLSLRIIRTDLFRSVEGVQKYLKKGLNIIGGRTCSGKTTLLYSSIHQFNGHVITLEDPVECHLSNISQTDVSLMGFEEGIKSALRQNPDLICIGEIRDKVSAQGAIKAALTGHAVLATIHITSAENLIQRLEDLDCKFYKEVLNNVFFMNNFKYSHYVFDDNILKEQELIT